MKIEVEISRPHYHPSHQSYEKLTESFALTRKRDLSVPPHWVANERVVEENGEARFTTEGEKGYAIVMPPRDQELWEDRQAVHIHCDKETFQAHFQQVMLIKINGFELATRVKPQEGYTFEPKIHFDHVDAEHYGINSGDFADV